MSSIKTVIKYKESVSDTLKDVSIKHAKILEKLDEIKLLLKDNAELMRQCLSKENLEIKKDGEC